MFDRNTKKGFLPISRSFFNHHLWMTLRPYSQAEAFLDLIQRANFEAGDIVVSAKVIHLQKGEQVASRRFLEKRWNWGNTKVRNFLKMLEATHEITQKQTRGETIISVCKYDSYTNKQPANKPKTNPPNNPEATQQQPKENKKKKSNNNTNKGGEFPSEQEFVDYCLEKIPEIHPQWEKRQIELCAIGNYRTYIEQRWKDGNGKKIVNWKTTIRNKFKYEKNWNYGKPNQTSSPQNQMFKGYI